MATLISKIARELINSNRLTLGNFTTPESGEIQLEYVNAKVRECVVDKVDHLRPETQGLICGQANGYYVVDGLMPERFGQKGLRPRLTLRLLAQAALITEIYAILDVERDAWEVWQANQIAAN